MGSEQKTVTVELTGRGRARTVTPLPTGLYFKLSVGRIDGEHEQVAIIRTKENLPPELYNAIYDSLEDDDVRFGDKLSEIAERIDESYGD